MKSAGQWEYPCLQYVFNHSSMPTSITTALADRARQRNEWSNQPVQTMHHRRAAAIEINIEYFIEKTGIDHVGFITLTFKGDRHPSEAVRCLQKLTKKDAFREFFPHWTWVMSFGENGRTHFHVLVACSFNIRTGFNVETYEGLRALNDQVYAEGRSMSAEEFALYRRLKKTETTNEALKRVRKRLRSMLKSSDFNGRFELTPILKSKEAISGYMKKNYISAVRARHQRFPGVHVTGASRNRPKVWDANFALLSSPGRFRYSKIGNALGIQDLEEMRKWLGNRWSFYLMPVIDELELRCSKILSTGRKE